MNTKQNDELRKRIPIVMPPDLLVVTPGIFELGSKAHAEILKKVRDFNDFNKGNDPYGEHDFGSFEHNDKKIFWKIDNYTEQPEPYRSVLTIMLADEY